MIGENDYGSERMVLVRLYGKLGAAFGREHRLSVSSVREALRALCIMLPGFDRYLETSEERGVTYTVFNGQQNISERDLKLSGVHDVIKIAPVLIGSKKSGMFQVIFGAVLVAAGVVMNFTPMMTASPFLYKFGAAMMLGGVAQMLAPSGSMGMTNSESDSRKSYAFGPLTNGTAAGSCVPPLWGERRIAPPIISAGIYVEQQA